MAGEWQVITSILGSGFVILSALGTLVYKVISWKTAMEMRCLAQCKLLELGMKVITDDIQEIGNGTGLALIKRDIKELKEGQAKLELNFSTSFENLDKRLDSHGEKLTLLTGGKAT